MYVLYGDYEHENSEVLCAFNDTPTVEVLRERIEMYGNGSWFEPPEMSDDVLQKLIEEGETALKWKYSSYYLYLKKVEVI